MKMDNKQRNIMLLGWIAGRAARGLQVENGVWFQISESDMHYPFNTFGRAARAWMLNGMPESCPERELELATACGHIDSSCDVVMQPNTPISQMLSGQFAFAWGKGRYGDRPMPEEYKREEQENED